MRNLLLVCGFLLIQLMPGEIQAQSITLDRVLEEYAIFVHGAQRANLKNISFSGTYTLSGHGVPFRLYTKGKQVHFAFDMSGKQKIKMVHTPDHSWLISSASGPTTIQHFPAQYFPLIYWHTDLSTSLYEAKAKGYNLVFEGQESTADGDRFIVQVSNASERTIIYYLSVDDYLPRRIKVMTKWDGKHEVVDYYLSEYKNVDGIPFPMRWETYKPDGRVDMVFEIK
ncbi:MAG: hypothetical protein AAFV07_07840, partial [Bacteroidota bacterium]